MFSNVRIEKLILSNYRNHKFLKLELKKNIILICGENGSGKTNILESISLITSSSGLKKTNLTEIINSNLKGPIELFGVNLIFSINNKKMKIGLGLKKNTNGIKKIINVEGLKTKKKLDQYFSIFWITPKMTFLFQNSREERRNFIDQMICSIDFSFKKFLLMYEKYKSERIKILKKWNKKSDEWLVLIEKRLAATGIIICDARRKFIKQLNFYLSDLDSSFHSLEIELSGELDLLLLKKPAIEVEDFFLKKLKENRSKDTLSGRTNFSANKTDFIVLNKNYKREAKNHSTGEQKVIIFLMIFSFMKILKNQKDLKILFLLDDVFSFLDKNFILRVLDQLNELKIQTWLTDVSGDWIMKKDKFKSIIDKINIDE